MAIVVKKNWIKTESGDWVNADHLDLIEAVQGTDGWQVVAWNALQPQVESYKFSTHKNESEARKAATKLIEELVG